MWPVTLMAISILWPQQRMWMWGLVFLQITSSGLKTRNAHQNCLRRCHWFCRFVLHGEYSIELTNEVCFWMELWHANGLWYTRSDWSNVNAIGQPALESLPMLLTTPKVNIYWKKWQALFVVSYPESTWHRKDWTSRSLTEAKFTMHAWHTILVKAKKNWQNLQMGVSSKLVFNNLAGIMTAAF